MSWRSPDLADGGTPARLTVKRTDEIVFEYGGTNDRDQLQALWCGDITGDDAIELGFQDYSGGAHCCFGIHVMTIEPRKTLLNAALGNAGGPEPRQLDDEGPMEIATYSDVLAYFGGLSFAASPFLPKYFAFRDGIYVDATTDFPKELRKEVKRAEFELQRAIGHTEQADAARYSALELFGLYVLLAEEDEGLEKVVELGLSDDDERWLRDHAAEAVETIRG